MTTFRCKPKFDIDKIFHYLKKHGFEISNPDCKTGNSFDIIVKGRQKIAGFDLLWDDTEPTFNIQGLEKVNVI